MWRHIASNALTMLIVGIFLLGGLILWGQSEYQAKGPLDEQICLRVERGSTVSRVSNWLADQGAVSSGMLLRVGMDYADQTGKLKAGSYLVPAGASMADIASIITKGGASTCGTEVVFRVGVTRMSTIVRELDPSTNKFVEKAKFDPSVDEIPQAFTAVIEQSDARFRLAVAEGVTSWQVVQGLKAISLLDGATGDVPAEGSLAPDSYEFKKGDKRADIIAQMSQRQEVILAAAWEGRAEGLPVKSAEEALVLASLIEKETGVAEERRQVASVFTNRLNKGMKLQTDPAVIYGITKGEGVLGRGLRRSELRKPTPFNTYVIDALPPTPIANPGRASIEAALNPDSTEYIFFVADGTGGHAFAVTLDEHNKNVAKWRAIEAERAND
ncbi:endolytic transglycosylase MltG [Lentibacter algarum]|uniref:endolytic transglycosylase MltG n=1 Tax=Lentibacter algarum TaxID=576131 RepID=UPI001C080C39|nr:endolytic transglycosylase MltG [Lentibacter algarum]MBU2982557.1 endolytic transglycosylase MltG [Lentibacter algarum]